MQTASDGRVVSVTNSYTILAAGMHYWKDGQWTPTDAKFELFQGNAVAQQGPVQLIITPDVAQEGSVDLLTPDGKRFLSSPRWLAYYNLVTHQSTIVAAVKSCAGQLVERNVLVFPDAFDDVRAAIRYSYHPWGFEQEIILLEPISPGEWGLAGQPEDIVLEMWSEFLAAPEADAVRSASVRSMDDTALEFGQSLLGPGKSFYLDDEENSVPVGKTWTRINQKQFLIEAVRQSDLAPMLGRLPPGAQAQKPNRRGVVQRKPVEDRAALLAAGSERLRARVQRAQSASIQRTTLALNHGVTIDYSIVLTASGFRFNGDSTFLVTNAITLSGAVVLDGGATIKFSPRANSPRILFSGTLDCRTSPFRPAFFTALDDDTAGQTISGSTGAPGTNRYALRALELFGVSAVFDLHDLRIRYADKAIQATSSYLKYTLSNSQIGNGNYGFYNNGLGNVVTARNVLMHDMLVATHSPDATNHLEHLTLHGIDKLCTNNSTANVRLTNSLLICVTNNVVYSGSNVETNLNDTGIFSSVGAGSRYLAARSPYRGAATTNINAALASDLRSRTTYAPTVLSGDFLLDTTLRPQARRDVGIQDLGYHYDPVDWCLSAKNLTNVTLTLTGGVVVAFYDSVPALKLWSGGKIVSCGDATRLNRLLPYFAIQEQPIIWGSARTGALFDLGQSAPSVGPRIDLRFTGLDLFQDTSTSQQGLLISTYSLALLSLADCHVRGGYLNIVPQYNCATSQSVALTNNLFEWTIVTLRQKYLGDTTPVQIQLRNNLFCTNTVTLINDASTSDWNVHDNLFDTVVLTGTNLVNSYNGYCSTAALGGPGTGNQTVGTADYQSGVLSRFYYPTSGGNLSLLLNSGSRNATNAALWSYTTTTNQVAETNSTVDIGYHSLAVNITSSGPMAVDTDADGMVDVWEDLNRNGSYDASVGETDWKSYNSLFGIGSGPGLVVFTPLK